MISFDDVYEFNEVISVLEPLSISVPPNTCIDDEIKPLGNSEPVGIVTVLPLDIDNWSPLIESV